jgi:ankyrin repeat protein
VTCETTEAEEQRYAELQLDALDCARRGDRDDLLATMLRAGMPVNLSDHKGNTLLMLAAYHGNADTVALLLDKGADPDRPNARAQTPLGGVAFKGYTAIALRLLDAGADIDADQGAGMTPLMYARMFGRTETALLLESRGAGRGPRLWRIAAPISGAAINFFRAIRNHK